MDFKAFILCFAFFVVTVSASAICKCAKEEDEPKDAVSKYKLKVKDGNTELDESIEIDTEKETEKFHIPDNGNTSDSAPGEVDVVYDFKLNLVMHRLSNQKACFLSNFTDNMPKPADLKKLLDMGSSQKKPENRKYDYVVDGAVNDRSFLSDEMVDLCSKLPIYRVKTVLAEEPPKRQKRRTCWYRVTTITICNGNGCLIIRIYRLIGCW